MGGIANGFAQLFKQGRKSIGNAIDNFWLDAEARKAISDEVGKKFQPMIDRANRAADRRATNLTELDKKLTQSKKDLQDAQNAWQQKYDAALTDAKNQRQTDITDYDTKLKGYQDAFDQANANKQSIFDKLSDSEDQFDPYKTIYTDVDTGDKYMLDQLTGRYENLTKLYKSKNTTPKDIKNLRKYTQGFGERLFDAKSKRIINAFDKSNQNTYQGKSNAFDTYYSRRISTQNAALRDADNQIKQADADLTAWKNNIRPSAWNKRNLTSFENDFNKNNGASPTEYSFNGKTYGSESDLDSAYQKALASEQKRKDLYSDVASRYASKRNAEIAQRIQDAKDIKKAKLALGAGAGAGALFAGAAAMYGGDDTDNTDNTGNSDNTNYGEPDPNFNVKKEGQTILNNEQQSDTESINTGFDPDKADALASAAYDQGVEDGNAARSSGDLANSIAAATGGHTMDDRLFELIKAMQDPYKADAVANYIYSRHGDDPEVQRLGWRGWLNKYYGDSLRSRMNIDPSGYKGMHISGGL